MVSKGTNNVIPAFEVEKSTSIYSGILRLTDLSYTIADGDEVFYLMYLIKEKRMFVCNYAALILNKTMYPLNTFYSLSFAAIAMHFASLEKAIIFWKKLQRRFNFNIL